MKKIIVICALLLSTSIVFPKPVILVNVDQWFDSYENLTWEDERQRLSSFAIFLKRKPETNGYIAFYVGKREKGEEVRSRIKRVKEFLVCKLEIKEDRIILVDAGEREENLTILQPVSKNNPPPNF